MSDRSPIERYADFVIRRKWTVLGLVGLLSLGATAGVIHLKFAVTYQIWFEPDSPTMVDFNQMYDTFGGDGQALVVFRDPDRGLLNNHALESIQRLTDSFWKVRGVRRVDSLVNFATARAARPEHEVGAFTATDD